MKLFIRCVETDISYALSGDEDSFDIRIADPSLVKALDHFRMHERYLMPMIAKARLIGFTPVFHGLIRAESNRLQKLYAEHPSGFGKSRFIKDMESNYGIQNPAFAPTIGKFKP